MTKDCLHKYVGLLKPSLDKSFVINNISTHLHSFPLSVIPEAPVIRGYTGSYDKDSEIKLECISTGNHPTPTMFWQIDGSRAGDAEFVVIPESNKTSTVTSFLTRTLSRDFDGSVVTCAVRNSVVSARGLEPVSTNITLHMSCRYTLL